MSERDKEAPRVLHYSPPPAVEQGSPWAIVVLLLTVFAAPFIAVLLFVGVILTLLYLGA